MNKDIYQNDDDEEHTGLHEECGVFGIYDLDGGDIASTIYYGCRHFSIVDRKAAE